MVLTSPVPARRWCFYINLPVGAFTLIFMVFFWNPADAKICASQRLDSLQAPWTPWALSSSSLAWSVSSSPCSGAAQPYPWISWRILPLFALFVALMIAFAVVQITMPETATLPPRVVMQRSVWSGALFTFFLSASIADDGVLPPHLV